MDDHYSDQLKWHKQAKQGCYFAAILADKEKSIKAGFIRKCFHKPIDQSFIFEMVDYVSKAIFDQSVNLVSLLIPSITSKSQLMLFIDLIRNNTEWEVDDSELYKGFRLVKIRIPLNEISENDKIIYSWVLFFGPFDFFPETRQSPSFEFVLSVKSRYFLRDKYKRFSLTKQYEDSIDRGGQSSDAHIADVFIHDVTDNIKRDSRKWNDSSSRKREILTKQESVYFDDNRAKAKITCSYPD
jgi:hypothetical protein